VFDLEAILRDIEDKFGLRLQGPERLSGGYLNGLYKLGSYVVKVFSRERYSKDQLVFVEGALVYQAYAQDRMAGICGIHSHEGQVIQKLGHQAYMLMSHEAGDHPDPDTVSLDQMKLLGKTCGHLHDLSIDKFTGYQVEDHLRSLRAYVAKISEDLPDEMATYMDQVKKIILDIPPDYHKHHTIGITHSDFSRDNMLMRDQDLVLIDFDRARIAYQAQDLGRAVMGLAFDGKSLDSHKIQALIEGYRQVKDLDLDGIYQALRLTWMIEFQWWFQPAFFSPTCKPKVKRFNQEIMWMTDQWFNLRGHLGL